jgi:hypothetical protein
MGTVIAKKGDDVTFTVTSIVAGKPPSGTIIVRLPNDARFLAVGSSYDVPASVPASTTFLPGAVGPSYTAQVKRSEDPCVAVVTHSDGTSIDTGLLTPLRHNMGRVVLAVALPILLILMALVIIVLLKRLLLRLAGRPV